MRLHRGLDDAARERQEALVERSLRERSATRRGGRPLPGRFSFGVGEPELLEAGRIEASRFVGSGSDVGRAQGLEVFSRALNRHLAMREAVAERRAAEAVHGPVVELGAEPAHGSRETKAGVVPPHRLREGERAHDLVQALGQGIEQRPPGDKHAEEAVAHLEVVDLHALLLREALRSFVAQMLGRALHPFVRLAVGEVVDQEYEPARADEDMAIPQPGELGAKLRPRLLASRGGELLAADLKQQARQSSPRRAGPLCARGCARGRCTPLAR